MSRGSDFSGQRHHRRDLLKTGLAASAALFTRPNFARAQEATPVATPSVALTDEERGWIDAASRNDINGWIHVKTGGEPFARGFQYGSLTAADYADAIRVYTAMTYQTMGFDYSFFVDK